MNKRIFFPDLDTIRFIAFLLVFLQHGFFNAFAGLKENSAFFDRVIRFFFLGGGTGVQIFFVLSGFLITYLIISEVKANGKLDIGKFYARRTLRIWPLYFATVIFAFLLYPGVKALIGISSNLCSSPWYYFVFLANFDVIHIMEKCPGKDAMIQGIVWSVSVEEQFYLIWPLLFIIFRRIHAFIFFLVLVICMFYRFSVMNDPEEARLYFHTLSVMGDLAIGGLGAYLAANNKRFLSFFEQLPRNLIGIFYIIIFIIYFYSDIVFQFPGAIIFGRWILDIFWLFIILEQNFAHKSLFKLRKLHGFATWGKYTYGLYMLHPIGILIINVVFRLMSLGDNTYILLIKGLLSFICSLCLAKLSYHWFEKPFLHLKEKMAVIRTKSV